MHYQIIMWFVGGGGAKTEILVRTLFLKWIIISSLESGLFKYRVGGRVDLDE